MAQNGSLRLEGKQAEYNVLECEYEFNQPVDGNGKPCAYPRGGLITFTILAPSDDDTIFHEWMISKADVKGGTFTFPVTVGTEHKKKTVTFNYAHCIRLHESFNNQNEMQMVMKITLSAAVIIFGAGKVTFNNNELLS
jgi:hypothetical protein